MVDFIFVVIELFSYLLRLRRYERKSVEVGVFRRGRITLSADFREKVASPTNHCWCQRTRVIAVSCGIKIFTVHHLVLSQYTHLTDRRTDGPNCDSNTVRCIACSRTAKRKKSLFEPPFRGLRGNYVRVQSICGSLERPWSTLYSLLRLRLYKRINLVLPQYTHLTDRQTEGQTISANAPPHTPLEELTALH